MKLPRASSSNRFDTAFVVEGLRGLLQKNGTSKELDLSAFVEQFDQHRKEGLTLQASAFAALLTLCHRTTQGLSDRIEALEAEPRTRYCGVYEPGTKYQRGDLVSKAGGLWHCQTGTSDVPGNGSSTWKLCVKRGRG